MGETTETPAATEDDNEIFAQVVYEAESPTARRFMPWHRPRKQYVRREQWLRQTRSLVDSLPADGPVKYLGLPGSDLLDLRAFYEALSPDRELLFLGFMDGGDEEARTSLGISMDELCRKEHVAERSRVVPDNISSLARANSMGMRYVKEFGPFDIINLDFCNNVLTEAIGDRSIYDAMNNVFAFQARRPHPWLFLLTTRAVRDTVHPDVSYKLERLLAGNIATCDGFLEALDALRNGANRPTSLESCDSAQWLDMFCVCISKVVLSAAIEGRMRVELKSTMSYRVGNPASGESDDLVSLAYLVTPSLMPGGDAGGLATAQPGPNECQLAVRLPPRIVRRVRVDDRLAADHALREAMIDESARLLVKARYSEDAYRAWLASQ